jgi:hypothetical protein
VDEIASVAGNAPVVFENSYREAPMYAFYSGETSYSLNNIYYRENQYNIDGTEALVQGKEVLYIAKRFDSGDMSYTTPEGNRYYGRFIDNFESYREIECTVAREGEHWQEGRIYLEVYNPYPENISMQKLKFAVVYMNSYKQLQEIVEVQLTPEKESITALPAEDETSFHFRMPAAGKSVPSFFRMAISENGLIWGSNSKTVKLEQWK